MTNFAKRLPCRGCTVDCTNYTACEGFPWRVSAANSSTSQSYKQVMTAEEQQLVIVAHGSRRESSNQEVRELAQKVDENLPAHISSVKYAFLELTEPSIDAVLNQCFEQGTNEIIVLPYLLSGGNHVKDDIPDAIAQSQKKWPNKSIRLLPHIGASKAMVSLVADEFLDVAEALKHH